MRRALRHWRYWVGYVLRYRTGLIVRPIVWPLIDRFGSRASFEGIKIIAPPVDKAAPEPPFLQDTVEALRLIQSVDPRRFRRVQREIAVVEQTPSLSYASYDRALRRCEVDYTRVDAAQRAEHSEWYRWTYAATLVHEATHGAVYSRHIHYTPRLRARIERLCCAEERRFAAHADREDRQWSDALVPPFDEKKWHANWHLTRWQRVKRITARFWETWRESRAKK